MGSRLLAVSTATSVAAAATLVGLAGSVLPAGAAPAATPASVTRQDAPTYAKPTVPTQVTASLVPGGVRVTWAPVSANPPVSHYSVHAGQGSCPVVAPAGATSAVLPVVAGQTVITPQVEAVNAYGFSPEGSASPIDVTGRASKRYVNLQLLQLSDFHGAIQASSSAAGAGVLAAAWQQDRARVPATLTVSSGDNIGGAPPASALFEEFPTIESLNLMGMDVSTFGNHEHDRPLEHVRRVVDASEFQWVVSNYSTVRPLAGKQKRVRDFVLVRRGGVTIGIVGMNTEDTPEVVAAGNLTDPDTDQDVTISASTRGVQRAIDRVRARGAEVVIVLAHQGWSMNVDGRPKGRLPEVARNLRGADIVYGGHTHQGYMSYVRNTLVAQVPNSGSEYSRTQVCVDTRAGRVVGADTEPVTVADMAGIAPDPVVQDLVDGYVERARAQLDVRVGVVADVFPRGGVPPVERSGETPMGTYSAEVVRRTYGTQLAFLSGGGIRDTLPASEYTPGDTTLRRPSPGSSGPYDVTLGDLVSVFPFGNNAATTRISGADLWKALENGVSGYPSDGRFPQIAGFRFAFDPARPVGERITSVTLADGRAIPRDSATYTVTTVDFMVYGGDGYVDVFRPAEAVIRGPYLDDIVAAIKKDAVDGVITQVPAPDGRIAVVQGRSRPKASTAPCTATGTTTIAGTAVPTCREFYASGAAVRLPADTAAATYGVWDGSGLLTRDGSTIPTAGDGWTELADVRGLYITASIDNGTAIDPAPALLVRSSAVLTPLVGTQATVAVQWMSPPDGIADAKAVLRFPSRSTATVATYRQGLTVSGRCIPALARGAAAREAYAPYFAKGSLELLWFPSMHTDLDSEIVIDSPSGPSWMTPGPALIDLLASTWKPTKVNFRIHANPIGTPANIDGRLAPARDSGRC
ncbi:MAG: bifunctional metallophosphatase/5'-nucleotidase [Actinomycetota bacterium]